jgi:hypothetical protein
MASAVIGSLRVNLAANTAAFSKGLKDADTGLKRFANSAKIAATAIAGAMVAAVGGLAVAMRGVINEADKLGKMAQSIGVPVEELSRMKHAADLSGISLEQLSTSVGRLSRNMSDVAAGVGKDASRAFDQLGISVKNADGSLKTSTQVMTEVADRFSRMEDGAAKTALAMQIFGRAGRDMIPMLNQGGDGLRRMMEEADELGIVIDSRTAKAAERFNDSLTRLGKVQDGIITQITARLAPGLANITEEFVRIAKEGDLVRRVADGLTEAFRWLATQVGLVVIEFRQFRADLKAMADLLSTSIFDTDAIARGLAQFGENARIAGDEADALKRRINNLLAPGAITWEEFRAEITGTANAFQVAAVDADKLKEAKARLTEAQRELNAAMREGQSVTEQMQTPLEAYEARMGRLRELLQAGAISMETFNRASRAAAENFKGSWTDTTDAVSGAITNLGQAFGKEGSKMAKVAQIVGAAQAMISVLVGQAQALALPFPANLAAAAKVLAVGLGIVAKIRSQNVPSFAEGGSFRVGGSGGIDSQVVAFMASPDEHVTVETPRQRRGETVNISLHGDVFGRRAVEGLIHSINDAVADGVQLRVAPA